jgi:hypothetical protein
MLDDEHDLLHNPGRQRSSVDDIDASNKQPRKVLEFTSITADILTEKHITTADSPYMQKILHKV